jgi:hypothetical protein
MMPLAPGRVSTITCCAKTSVSFAPMRRPTMSGPEPGELSAISLIGRSGYAAAEDFCA